MSVRKRQYQTQHGKKAYWEYQFQRDKQSYLKGGFATKTEAVAAEEEIKRQIRFDERHVVEVKRATLREIYPLFLGHRRAARSEGTARREERFGRQIIARMGDRVMADVTPAEIHAYVATRKNEGLANRSVNLELNTLRVLFRFAVDCQCARENPVEKVKTLREPRHDHWIPSPEELERFIGEAEKTYSGKVLPAWIRFMAYTGMRPREALFVEWTDIDWDRQQIVIKPKHGNPLKSGKTRYVELHDRLKTILLEWREEWKRIFAVRAARHPDEKTPPHDWVFYNPRKQLERADSFNTCFETIRRRSNLPKMTPYTLRHFFISYCVMSGIDFLTISRWVGHASTHMIEQVYGHLTPSYRAQQMGKFDIQPKPVESASLPHS